MRTKCAICFISICISQHSQCVPVCVGYQVAAYIRAYKVNVEVGSFVRRCAFAVLGQKCQAALVRWEMSTTPKAKVSEGILLSPSGDVAFRLSNAVDRWPTVGFHECPHREKYSVSRTFIISPAN